jgi:hypothetical protein
MARFADAFQFGHKFIYKLAIIRKVDFYAIEAVGKHFV